MQQIQGFVTKSSFISNANRTVAEFFELSPLALTYSRDRCEYQHADFPGTTLHTFQSVDASTDTFITVPPALVNEVMRIVESVLSYVNSHVFPYSTPDFKDTIRAAYFSSITDFTSSDLFVGAETTLPEWISWTSLQEPNTEIKIWLRNDSFESQYGLTEILPVSLISVLDDFFGNYGTMVGRLGAMALNRIMTLIQETKDGYPATVERIYTFNYINPNNPTQSTPVNWGAVIYGANGDNLDSIKETLANYILENSQHPREDWEVIFPTIFRRTEFLFLPRWDKIAIPNLTDISALYSSIQGLSECLSYAQRWLPSIDYGWIQDNTSVVPFDYKGIAAICLNGKNNAVGYETLYGAYSDYIPVNTASVDYARMKYDTRQWLTTMLRLIAAAETATETSSLAGPMRKVHRDGLLYIAEAINDVNFMVLARSNKAPEVAA